MLTIMRVPSGSRSGRLGAVGVRPARPVLAADYWSSGTAGPAGPPGPLPPTTVVWDDAGRDSLMLLAMRVIATPSRRKTPNTRPGGQGRPPPFLEPRAVLPPAPPKALANPPPRPFWIRISRIMKKEMKMNRTRMSQKRKFMMVPSERWNGRTDEGSQALASIDRSSGLVRHPGIIPPY